MILRFDGLLAYTAAAALLVLVPGPAQALVLARSIESGARAGVVTAVGLDAATMVHTLAAALGLSAILATSATAFSLIKLAGAIYLVLLGLRMLRDRSGTSALGSGPIEPVERAGVARLLAHGFVTGLLNPKVALFFLAFLPQFVRPERGNLLAQFPLLGAILALLANRAQPPLRPLAPPAQRTDPRRPRAQAGFRQTLRGSLTRNAEPASGPRAMPASPASSPPRTPPARAGPPMR